VTGQHREPPRFRWRALGISIVAAMAAYLVVVIVYEVLHTA
jgi:hypothetical protein